jgi:hypothetical protein
VGHGQKKVGNHCFTVIKTVPFIFLLGVLGIFYPPNSMFLRGRLGGVMVSVLVTGPNVSGFKPGRSDTFLRAIKIRSTPFFRREVKPLAPCRKILRHVKELYEYERDIS